MKRIIREYWLTMLGVFLGAISGYLYWFFVGCTTGTCPLQSSPLYMILWGGATGGLLLSIVNNLLKNNK